ncbi:MAG: recombinase family protein [Anaerolineae bacterium]|nr:recombinase family protein [Anaerolineae bacterium]
MISKRDRHLPIVLDPERAKVWRLAWDLLLTGRYTLVQVCQELHDQGYTRRSGKPWVMEDPATGKKSYATSHLSRTFRSPFYAGWVTSDKYGIRRGEVRGNWPALVSNEEYDRGLAILAERDGGKIRQCRQEYLLKGLLFMRIDEESQSGPVHRMCGSTPTGRSKSYRYYITTRKPQGIRRSVPCMVVDDQIPALIRGVSVDSEELPKIRKLYSRHIKMLKGPSADQRCAELKGLVARFKTEESALARLYAQGRLTDESYDQLHSEWQAKLFEAESELRKLANEPVQLVDDLEVALLLLSHLDNLYERLEQKECSWLLRILFKHIIINTQGIVIDFELNSPFVYLHALAKGANSSTQKTKGGLNKFLSSPPDRSCSKSPPLAVEEFITMLSFPQRSRVDEFYPEIVEVDQDGFF